MTFNLMVAMMEVTGVLARPKVHASLRMEVVRTETLPGRPLEPDDRQVLWPGLQQRLLMRPGRLRIEHWAGERLAQVFLAQLDSGKLWTFWPRLGEYMQLDRWSPPAVFRTQALGMEQLEGTMTTRYESISDNREPLIMTVEWWSTADGIIKKLHLDVKQSCEGYPQLHDKTWSFQLVSRAQQPSDLFEVPAGFAPYGMGKVRQQLLAGAQ